MAIITGNKISVEDMSPLSSLSEVKNIDITATVTTKGDAVCKVRGGVCEVSVTLAPSSSLSKNYTLLRNLPVPLISGKRLCGFVRTTSTGNISPLPIMLGNGTVACLNTVSGGATVWIDLVYLTADF